MQSSHAKRRRKSARRMQRGRQHSGLPPSSMDRSSIYARHTPSHLTVNNIKVWLGAGYAMSDLQDVRRSRHIAGGLQQCLQVDTSCEPPRLAGTPSETYAGNAGEGVAGPSAAQPLGHHCTTPDARRVFPSWDWRTMKASLAEDSTMLWRFHRTEEAGAAPSHPTLRRARRAPPAPKWCQSSADSLNRECPRITLVTFYKWHGRTRLKLFNGM